MTKNITYSDQKRSQVYKFMEDSNLLDSLTETMHKDYDSVGVYKTLRFFEIIPNDIWRKYGNSGFDTFTIAEILTDRGDFVKLTRSTPIGALFEADYSYGETYIPVQLLWEIEQHRVLNPAQMHELELSLIHI